MATMKLADTAVGALRLQRLKTKMAAFVMEHPDEGIDLEMFYQAINPDIAHPQVAAEIATCIRNAIELYEALTVDVPDAPMPGEKRPAPPPPDLPRSPPARQAPHVADPLLAGGRRCADDAGAGDPGIAGSSSADLLLRRRMRARYSA